METPTRREVGGREDSLEPSHEELAVRKMVPLTRAAARLTGCAG